MTVSDPEMRIKSIAPWFGAKRGMAQEIIRELGPHDYYFEPFCGSLAVLLVKPRSRYETVNDLHGDLTNLARVLAREDSAARLYERLQGVLFCDGLLKDAQAVMGIAFDFDFAARLSSPKSHDGEALIDRAYWFFIASWMACNGIAGTDRNDYQVAVRWTAKGGSSSVRWRSAVESIPAWQRRLSNVVILRRDAFEIIPRVEDAEGTAIYADPPYHPSSTGARKGKGHRYTHNFSHQAGGGLPVAAADPSRASGSNDDHSRLRDQLAAFKRARVVVSYYDCPQIRELYQGWTFVEHTRTRKLLTNMNRKHDVEAPLQEAPELLILNGPSYAGADRGPLLAEMEEPT